MKSLKYLFGLCLVLGLVANSHAHRFAPSLLKIQETKPNTFTVVWKTPIQTTSSIPLVPSWPKACAVQTASPAQVEGTGKVSTFQLACAELGEAGLVGSTVSR